MKITPNQLYDALVNQDKILEAEGRITFSFSNVNIIVHQRDVVGSIIQEWLEGWLKHSQYEYATNDNSQMPPDFFLDVSNKKHFLLEVKAFNNEATPGFDIADFRMYEEELIKKPWMLDVDYLIFGYEMSPLGVVTVKNLWLKKVWEMTSSSGNWPLKLQVKKNIVHKIRPCNWYSPEAKFPIFASKEDFISALEETVFRNPATHNSGGTWRAQFQKAYFNFYNEQINFKRWDEIKNKYSDNK